MLTKLQVVEPYRFGPTAREAVNNYRQSMVQQNYSTEAVQAR